MAIYRQPVQVLVHPVRRTDCEWQYLMLQGGRE